MPGPMELTTHYWGPQGGNWKVRWVPLNDTAKTHCLKMLAKSTAKGKGKGKPSNKDKTKGKFLNTGKVKDKGKRKRENAFDKKAKAMKKSKA